MHFKRLLSVPCKNKLHCLIFIRLTIMCTAVPFYEIMEPTQRVECIFCFDFFLWKKYGELSKGLTFNHCLAQSGTDLAAQNRSFTFTNKYDEFFSLHSSLHFICLNFIFIASKKHVD